MFKKVFNSWWHVLLWIFIFTYIAYFSTFTILRFRHLYAEYFDLGIMQHTVYNTYQAIKTGDWSRFLELTAPYGGGEQIKRMAIHNDIILAPLALFYFLHAGPETLLILQTIVLALGAWVVFKISKLLLKHDFLSFAFAFAYLMYAPMQRANIFEFHAVTFATTFILFMFYFWLKGKIRWSLLFLILALITKEEVGLTLGMFGLYMTYRRYRRNVRYPSEHNSLFLPMLITIISWGWALISVFWIAPAFRGSQHFATHYYDSLFSNAVGYIFNKSTLDYFFYLLGPIAFLTLLAPEFILISSPELAINLFSSNMQLRSLYFQYTSVIQPWVFIGVIYGAHKILRWKIPSIQRYIGLFIILLSLMFNYLKGPLPYSAEKNVDPWLYDRKGEYEIVKTWQTIVAADTIKVSSTDQIAPFFTSRRYFYIFSLDYKKADYVILSLSNIQFSYRTEVKPAYEELKKNSMFEKVFDQNGYEVYKKKIYK